MKGTMSSSRAVVLVMVGVSSKDKQLMASNMILCRL
jgi:hypothetical protein